MRKRKKLNEWCHAATCLRVSLAGKDVLYAGAWFDFSALCI